MRVLHRKLLRELLANAGALVSVVAIIAIGAASFIGLGSTVRNLERSQADYYRDYRFADFWVDVKKAPLSSLDGVTRIEGLAVVEPRIVFDVILDVAGEPRPLTGRLISTPPEAYDRVLNGLCLVRGAAFSDDRDEEVILSEAFAAEHGLRPGDRVELILNRKRQSFVIVGTAISPEYVYMVRGEGDVVPDPRHFGILYVKEDYARDVLDFRDAYNQLVGRVAPGMEQHIELLLERVARELDAYGVLATTPRERQASHRFLSDEIGQQRTSATITPTIFLGVAALVLNVLMSRLAERQRTIIGTLKALGYSDRGVLGHFVSFGLVIGLAGGGLGMLLGIGQARGMLAIYSGVFQFPSFAFRLYPDLLLAGLAISIVFAVGGTAKGVWTVLRLHPAEAMRPRPPERGGAIFLERWRWLWQRLGFRTHLALRSLARHPVRTATGVFSTALATAIILMALILYDSLWFLVDFQFEQVARSDLDIGLRDPASMEALLEARRLPGVDYAEPIFSVTCDVRHGRYGRRLAVIGLSQEHRLTVLMSGRDAPLDLPESGLVMSAKLAELLGARVGDRLELTPVRGRRETVRAALAKTMESYLGLDCYADLAYLSRLVGEPQAVGGVQMKVDERELGALYREIKRLPNAQNIAVRTDTRRNIEETFIKTISIVYTILILFAGTITFGSILNNALVEIGDRTRDISTFRVLGYKSGQIAAIFFRQSMIVCLFGLLLGFPISYALVQLVLKGTPSEMLRIPIQVRWETLALGTSLTLLFVFAAQAIVYREIRRLDWLEGVKVKE